MQQVQAVWAFGRAEVAVPVTALVFDLDVQYRRGSLYLEEPSDVGFYGEVFDHLRARALGPDESRALIAGLADQMT